MEARKGGTLLLACVQMLHKGLLDNPLYCVHAFFSVVFVFIETRAMTTSMVASFTRPSVSRRQPKSVKGRLSFASCPLRCAVLRLRLYFLMATWGILRVCCVTSRRHVRIALIISKHTRPKFAETLSTHGIARKAGVCSVCLRSVRLKTRQSPTSR